MTRTPAQAERLGRRKFLAVSSLAGSGLVLGLVLRASGDGATAAEPPHRAKAASEFKPSVFIRITTDGVVTLVSKQMEVGQGVKTALPMVLAEELEVDWKDVVVEQGALDEAYGNQFSGASSSTLKNYAAFRLLGATARTLLVQAAANAWGVPAQECHAALSTVHHRASGRSLRYGELATRAAALPVPTGRAVKLKSPRDFKLVGTRVGGVDNDKIVRGAPLFGIDVRLPGMRHAVFEKSPVFGASVASANLAEVKALPGVLDAFVVEGIGGVLGLRPGVAIVAESTWAAFSARKKLKVQWADSPVVQQGWSAFAEQAARIARQPGANVSRQEGNVAKALASASQRVEAFYTYPFIAHAAMEPLNCTAWFKDGALQLWTASQAPAWARDHVSKSLGVPPAAIQMHIVRGGGSFGRRLSSDYVVEAAAVAMRSSGPVQLVWSREDDLQHDHFRAAGFHLLRGGLDARGDVVAWHDHFVGFGRGGPIDPHLGQEFPAPWVADCTVEQSAIDCGVPMGAWRAPHANVSAWVVQSFVDELAHAAKQDPLAFRLALLGDRKEMRPGGFFSRQGVYQVERMRRVLQAVAEKSQWGRPLPRGQAQGIAFHASYGGYVAQVAEVTVSPEGQLRVNRVVCVCDVGEQIVNLSGAEAQVQGSILDGLSAAWLQVVDIEGGRAKQSNFHEYPLLRMADAPAIEVHFLRSDNPIGGLGEPALPPVAPAVCNAIFRATGHRVRELPIQRARLAWA